MLARPPILSRHRRASLAVELLFVLPLLLLVLLGTVELSLWLTAQQQVALASREGARAAARGGNAQAVLQAVQQVLGPNRAPAAQVQATLTDASGQPLPSGAAVSVLVALPAGRVVPDLLGLAGLSIANETLASQTVMSKE
jgi:hypothetical protein